MSEYERQQSRRRGSKGLAQSATKAGTRASAPDVRASRQGRNSAVVRHYNERVILAALRRTGGISRADLARATSLTENTVGLIMRDLIEAGLVREGARRVGARGQPATLLSLDPDGLCSIGIKLGRRSLGAALVDFSGTILHLVERERALRGPAAALVESLEAIAELRALAQSHRRIAGVGVSMPYDLASWRRELGATDDIVEQWKDYDFVGALRAAMDLPVFAENDGTAAAVASLFHGYGRDHDDFVVVFLDEAIGGGVVLNGDYRRGPSGNAGDVGLILTSPSHLASAPRPDRAFELLMTRASIGSLVRHLRWHGVSIAGRDDLTTATRDNADLVDAWLDDCADSLARPLRSIGALLDIEAIVVDGDLETGLLHRLVARIRERMAHDPVEARPPPDLLVGTIGRDAATIGAALLPIHLAFRPDQRLLSGTAA